MKKQRIADIYSLIEQDGKVVIEGRHPDGTFIQDHEGDARWSWPVEKKSLALAFWRGLKQASMDQDKPARFVERIS